MEPCRKCKTLNPSSNQYCLSCGAVLNVSTAMVRAQPKTLMPLRNRFSWKWLLLGTLAMLGISALALVGGGALLASSIGAAVGSGSLTSTAAKAPGMAVLCAVLFLLSFLLGGWAVARMSKGRTVIEPVIASLLVLGILGGASASLSPDAIWIAAVAALPCALVSALGGWIGELGFRKKGGVNS